jgi:predicted NAD-dependent protein-ADP-ribosyltransferase YbiA (DUF1768 family)
MPLVFKMSSSNDKLFFYSRSKHVNAGQGACEVVADPAQYAELNRIKDWRRVLSNFHVSPFVYKGHTYNSIEHVFQAEKIRLMNPDIALRFTMESGDEIGMGDGAMAQKHRKIVLLPKPQLAVWDAMKENVMAEAAAAKYAQCPEAAKILKATKEAQLWHLIQRSSNHIRFEHLEEIRRSLE